MANPSQYIDQRDVPTYDLVNTMIASLILMHILIYYVLPSIFCLVWYTFVVYELGFNDLVKVIHVNMTQISAVLSIKSIVRSS